MSTGNSDELIAALRTVSEPSFWDALIEHYFEEYRLREQAKYQRSLPNKIRFSYTVSRTADPKLEALPDDAELMAVAADLAAERCHEQWESMLATFNLIRSLLPTLVPRMLNEPPVVEIGDIGQINPKEIAQTMTKVLGDLQEIVAARRCRLTVTFDPKNPQVTYDGDAFAVSWDVAQFFQAMITADGNFVSATNFKVRSRDIKKLPELLSGLIESETGKGMRIPREKLRLS